MGVDLNELDLENIAEWPLPVKVALIAIVCIIIFVLGYMFDIKSELRSLNRVERKEASLRQEFELKHRRAARLNAYKQQMREMEHSLGAMLQKLPDRTEVSGLLEDISELGIANGLEFKFFKPLPEKEMDFYAELPISIEVVGHFHQLAKFISEVSNMKRIVVLGNFTLKPFVVEKDKNKKGSKTRKSYEGHKRLVLEITARTYRYMGEVHKL